MTTPRQSLYATDPQDDSLSTSTLFDAYLDHTPSMFTPESLAANTERMSHSTYSTHPVENQAMISWHRRTRFTLHRIFSVAIPTAFIIPKFIHGFHRTPVTLGFVDLILATLQLSVCSWYESDPPPCLRWLHDTDWPYLFRVSREWTVMITEVLVAGCCFLVVALSVLLSFHKAIRLFWSGPADDVLQFLSFKCLALLFIYFHAVLTTYGIDEHRGNLCKFAFVVVVGISTQLGMIAMWATTTLSQSRYGEWTWVATIGLSVLGSYLILLTDPPRKPIQFQAVTSGMSLCKFACYYSFIIYSMKQMLVVFRGGDPDPEFIFMIKTFAIVDALIQMAPAIIAFIALCSYCASGV